ncbi:hypothetical protein ACTXT7_007902 [Hymenolepis weldensis]
MHTMLREALRVEEEVVVMERKLSQCGISKPVQIHLKSEVSIMSFNIMKKVTYDGYNIDAASKLILFTLSLQRGDSEDTLSKISLSSPFSRFTGKPQAR